MSLKKYLEDLEPAKREVLLGRETKDALHEAFAAKRVVHAGLLGTPVMKDAQQEAWAKVMAEPADARRQHAVYIHIPFCQTKCLYCSFFQSQQKKTARPRMFRHFVPSRELHSLAPLMRLSLVDLPSANSIKCCSPPASLKANKMNFMEQANRNF